MDIAVDGSYHFPMIARLVAILAALAIIVMTTVVPVHAARMHGEADHTMQVGAEMHAEAGREAPCDDKSPCGSTDKASCEMLCTGISPFIVAAEVAQGCEFLPAGHDIPHGAINAHRVPEVGQRPPNPPSL